MKNTAKNQVEIEVCERLMDYWWDHNGKQCPKYHVQIKGESGYWSCGRSTYEAIGNLINTHPERFGIKITYLEKLPR